MCTSVRVGKVRVQKFCLGMTSASTPSTHDISTHTHLCSVPLPVFSPPESRRLTYTPCRASLAAAFKGNLQRKINN